MKTFRYIAAISLSTLLAASICACSEKEEIQTDDERGIAIESFSVTMEGMDNGTEAITRADEVAFSVNGNEDPTMTSLADRGTASGWKIDFAFYDNTGNKYTNTGFSFTEDYTTNWNITAGKCYFPNYKKPKAKVYIYPNGWTIATPKPAITQNTKELLLAQDVLFKEATLPVSHEVSIELQHKHAMLDFVIKDVTLSEINTVTVKIGDTEYTPYNVAPAAGTAGNKEYMLILPEETNVNPTVIITTNKDTNIDAITYQQTISIIGNGKTQLGSNKCYCFTLQGAELKISPVTVISWTTGESLPGEYIAVTAYPTFKGRPEDAENTYYFYYDNCLTEKDNNGNSKAKLQAITFNKNSECTIKPDGRILTHIGTEDDYNKLTALEDKKVILGAMVIDLKDVLDKVAPKHK